MNNHREVASAAIYLKEWANDIDANSGGHSVDAAKLRSIAATIEALTAKIAGLEGEVERKDAALSLIADAPAWGYPERWDTTPSEVRQLARAALSPKDGLADPPP